MQLNKVLKSMVLSCLALALTFGAGCGKPKKAEGKPCKDNDECKSGLKCVNARCTDFSGKHPACQWSLNCLKKLSEKYAKTNKGYEVIRWYKKLSKAPYKSDCLEMPKRVAFLMYNEPHVWKAMCGAPPVRGVKKVTNKTNPFRINDKQIKAGGVPKEEKPEIHKRHLAYPDLCKAWVDFTITRPFQGWVIAKFYEQYDCDEEAFKARQKDPNLKPKCKTKPYARDDRRYLFLHDAGAKFSLYFYVSTPPEVCKKKNLSDKFHKTGCFCLGVSEETFELDFQDDPFLYLDQMNRPKR
ncbi:MAG: hypothetical protein ABI333_30340 [bacterium]